MLLNFLQLQPIMFQKDNEILHAFTLMKSGRNDILYNTTHLNILLATLQNRNKVDITLSLLNNTRTKTQ